MKSERAECIVNCNIIVGDSGDSHIRTNQFKFAGLTEVYDGVPRTKVFSLTSGFGRTSGRIFRPELIELAAAAETYDSPRSLPCFSGESPLQRELTNR